MFDFLKKIARDKNKLIMAGIGLLAVVYIDVAFVIGAQVKGLSGIKQKVVSLKNDINTLNKDIQYVKTSKRKEPAVIKTKALLSERDIPLLLRHISNMANESGVRIMQIDSTKEVSKPGKAGAQSRAKKPQAPQKGSKPSGAKSAPETGLTAVKIKMDVVASYHKLGKFINAIENGDKYCSVDEVLITRDKTDQMRESVNLVLKTYVK